MAGVRQGMASFPGVLSVTGCSATISHGITPGTIVLRCNPQATFPPGFGSVVISDGVGSVLIPNCKISSLQIINGSSGDEWSISIVDKRWKWREFGAISGRYNQLDPHGKLIPWMIRSPYELALLCLQAMGETNFSIDMPPGLNSATGKALSEYVGVGLNFPSTGTNPPIDWNCEVPAVALQRLCDMFGRRIVYDPIINKVMIVRPGIGGSLPPGSIASEGPVANMPSVPDGVAVYGSPTKFQARFEMEAVGEEWNGEYKKLDALSYAPLAQGATHQITWTITCPSFAVLADRSTLTVNLKINIPLPDGSIHSFSTQKTMTATETENQVLNRVKDTALNDPIVKQKISITVATNVMTFTANVQGDTFDVEYAGFVPGVDTDLTQSKTELVRQGKKGVVSWEYTKPPLFSNVRATARLTYAEAVKLAQKSVYRCYRMTGRDVTKKGNTIIPGFGPIQRKQQVYLLPTKVDQIVPEKNDPKVQDVLGRPITVNFYNGYSKDKPGILIGSVARYLESGLFDLREFTEINTPANSQIFVDFSIDPEYQLITANNYLFRDEGSKVKPADLILETGCHVMDSITNQYVCYIRRKPLGSISGGTGLYKFDIHPDVQLNYTATYLGNGRFFRERILETDAVNRAGYYINGMVAQYFLTGGQTIEYNGIVPIHLDGAIAQASWDVGSSGASTRASRNTEHDIYVPPYPMRRRAELLDPIAGGNKQLLANAEMRVGNKPQGLA